MVKHQLQKVYDKLRHLTRNHHVEVEWMDACEIRTARPEDVERNYRTLMATCGRFYGVGKGYLILEVETGSLGMWVVSIPLGCILNVKVLSRMSPTKRPLRLLKIGAPIASVKVLRVYVKQNLNPNRHSHGDPPQP